MVFFLDKTLYCCQTAKESFLNILYTVGGPNERIRGEELLGRTIILPDDATVANTLDSNSNNEVFNSVQYTSDKNLSIGGKIKERSLIIFTFGDRIKAITVTSNDGFVRAAKQQASSPSCLIQVIIFFFRVLTSWFSFTNQEH